jgi:hypothetical protein
MRARNAANILQPYGHCLPLDGADLGRLRGVARGSSSSAMNATVPRSPCATHVQPG